MLSVPEDEVRKEAAVLLPSLFERTWGYSTSNGDSQIRRALLATLGGVSEQY